MTKHTPLPNGVALFTAENGVTILSHTYPGGHSTTYLRGAAALLELAQALTAHAEFVPDAEDAPTAVMERAA